MTPKERQTAIDNYWKKARRVHVGEALINMFLVGIVLWALSLWLVVAWAMNF